MEVKEYAIDNSNYKMQSVQRRLKEANHYMAIISNFQEELTNGSEDNDNYDIPLMENTIYETTDDLLIEMRHLIIHMVMKAYEYGSITKEEYYEWAKEW